MAAAVKVTQTRSVAGTNGRQRDTLRSLGLGRIGKRAEHKDTPQLRGMIRVVDHLVKVEGADS